NDGVEDFVNKNQDLEPDNNNSSDSRVPPKSSEYSKFRTPLKDSTKSNLPFHINATKKIQLLVEKGYYDHLNPTCKMCLIMSK
ncbi:12976_t:CDS:2, partial [Gigaspora rosea]